MSYPDKQPMSWSGKPATPGHAAVNLRKARRKVERIALLIVAAQRRDEIGMTDYVALYSELHEAAKDLVAAEHAWAERHSQYTQDDFELVGS
jgi:hypothetical protein